MALNEIRNEKGDVVGLTDRNPATVQVELLGNPLDPTYRLVDGNGEEILQPEQEKAKLLQEVARTEARLKALKDLTKEKEDEKVEKAGKPGDAVL